jgi:hypothetical protein
VRVKKTADPHSNGVVPAPPAAARPPGTWKGVGPWWLLALLAGTLMTGLAILLHALRWSGGGLFFFMAAACAIGAGLAGLVAHYRREQSQHAEADEPVAPHVYRSTVCRVEQPILDKLARAVKAMHQRAEERQWEIDRQYYGEHRTQAETLLAQGDLPGAFREYCRAMMPLSSALNKQRNKEETFQPLWDKAR